MDDTQLARFTTGYTLIDITRTLDTNATNSKTRNQQRNFETLVQVLGLRTQVMSITTPVLTKTDLSNYKFGSEFKGKHNVWSFVFEVEKEDIYATSTDPYGGLLSDLTNVPIVPNLNETIKLNIPIFSVTGLNTNIYFEVKKS